MGGETAGDRAESEGLKVERAMEGSLVSSYQGRGERLKLGGGFPHGPMQN